MCQHKSCLWPEIPQFFREEAFLGMKSLQALSGNLSNCLCRKLVNLARSSKVDIVMSKVGEEAIKKFECCRQCQSNFRVQVARAYYLDPSTTCNYVNGNINSFPASIFKRRRELSRCLPISDH